MRNKDEDSQSRVAAYTIAEVALSSTPGHLRPIVRQLRRADFVDVKTCGSLCAVARPTARRYMKELELLGIVEVIKGSPASNEPDSVKLANEFQWMKEGKP